MISLESLGFSLFPVETRDGSKVWQLETPFTLANEFPLDIFIEEKDRQFRVFDEGFTFHDLVALGVDFSVPKRLNTIKNHAQKFDVSFSDSGVFEAIGDIECPYKTVENYLAAMLDIDQWVNDVFTGHSTKNNLIARSKMLFKKWKPNSVIQDTPKVQIATGKQLEFDFCVDDEYVDVFGATQKAVQPFLFKAVGCSIPGGEPIKVLGVVDDREDKNEAQNFKTILSTVSSVMLYTDLEKQANSFSIPA